MSDTRASRGPISRRGILLGGIAAGATVGLTALGGNASAGAMPAVRTARQLVDPFTLGVASGDPAADGVVLWTRLAPTPLADDGLGGMPNRVIPVEWEIATDETFRRVVRRGATDATPAAAHSVHVELNGLRPGAEYFYRFRADGTISPTGRTKTTPERGARTTELTMCFASCAQYEHGFFTAYRRLAEDHPDLVLHLGDYHYEYQADVYVAPGGNVRDHQGPETETLANYRQRHAQYKTDPDLQAAHAIAPWAVVFDDHEVDNNWADEIYEHPETPQPNFLARRAAAFRAYYENMPLRRTSLPAGIDLRLYRRLHWGDLATFHMLDTRQFRSDQACGDGVKAGCDERLDPNRSITGAEQEKWIIDGFRRSRAAWDVLGQQVFFSQIDLTPGANQGYNMDAWDGYKANRDRIAAAMGNSRVRNGVVLTGDVHQHWAAEIKENFGDPESRGVGTELVATSITSNGDGTGTSNDAVLAENPHVKCNLNRRGYVRTRFTARELRADYRALPFVQQPGAPAETAATFVIEDRDPTLHRA